jgi:hypothetical protein
MFGEVWPIKQWALLGAVIGALFQIVQIMGRVSPVPGSMSYNAGRLIGGLFVGAVIGCLVALIRNALAAKRR